MPNPKLKPVILALALVALGPLTNASAPAADSGEKTAATPQATPQAMPPTTPPTPPQTAITSDEEAAIATAGVKALRYLSQIRANVHNGTIQEVDANLGKVETLLETIQAAVPTSGVRDRIWIAKKHLEYESAMEVLPDLTPIYASLDELAHFMPVDEARKHIDQAKEQLTADDKAKAHAALDVADATLQFTEVDLPLSVTRRLLGEAKKSLAANDADRADQALKSAEDSLVYLSVAIQQPLFRAKAMLWRAVLDFEAGNVSLAQTDLEAAIADLDTATQSDQKATREAASAALPQAKQFLATLESGNDIGARLRGLVGRTQALADRSVQYVATGWARYRAPSPYKADLIEARLHVEYARIDRFTGHDLSQAKQELGTAAQLLGQAADQARQAKARDEDQDQIAGLQKAATGLAAATTLSGAAKYYDIETPLDALIGAL